jgi:predicted dehydrogenase
MIRWFIAGGLLKKWRGFGIAHVFPDANNLIRHPDVDLVVVLPPAARQSQQVKIFIASGRS